MQCVAGSGNAQTLDLPAGLGAALALTEAVRLSQKRGSVPSAAVLLFFVVWLLTRPKPS